MIYLTLSFSKFFRDFSNEYNSHPQLPECDYRFPREIVKNIGLTLLEASELNTGQLGQNMH